MRMSTNMMYEFGLRGVQSSQAEQIELQQRISSSHRINKPSDDPIGAAAVIGLNQAKSVNAQFGQNAQNAQALLSLEVDALGAVTRILQDVKALIVKAGNPSLQNQDRVAIGAEVQVLYDELVGVANSGDGNGEYMFSGYKGTTQPFAETAPGVVAFAGDEGQRMVQIGAQRRLAVSDSGSEVFLSAREGNGVFVTRPTGTNQGSGVAGEGTIRDLAAWKADGPNPNYTVVFDVSAASPPVTTYDIIDNTRTPVASALTGNVPGAAPYPRTYNTGSSIDFQLQPPGDTALAGTFDAGIRFEMTGAPGTGDTFNVTRAGTKDLFSTIHDLAARLSNPLPVGAAPRAIYDSELTRVSSSLDSGMDHISVIRASTGVRLKELDSAQNTAGDLSLRYDQDLSRLQDLDYAAALSELAQKQFSLEAAQKSFIAITSLKLFDFIR